MNEGIGSSAPTLSVLKKTSRLLSFWENSVHCTRGWRSTAPSLNIQGDGNEENDEVRSRNDELKAARSRSPSRYPICLPIRHSSFSSITPQGDGNEENDEVRNRNDELKAARSRSPSRYPICLPIHHSSFITHHSSRRCCTNIKTRKNSPMLLSRPSIEGLLSISRHSYPA